MTDNERANRFVLPSIKVLRCCQEESAEDNGSTPKIKSLELTDADMEVSSDGISITSETETLYSGILASDFTKQNFIFIRREEFECTNNIYAINRFLGSADKLSRSGFLQSGPDPNNNVAEETSFVDSKSEEFVLLVDEVDQNEGVIAIVITFNDTEDNETFFNILESMVTALCDLTGRSSEVTKTVFSHLFLFDKDFSIFCDQGNFNSEESINHVKSRIKSLSSAVDENFATPLHIAAYVNNLDACRILIENGYDNLLAVDSGMKNVLHYAFEGISLEFIEYFLRKASVDDVKLLMNAKEFTEKTPLFCMFYSKISYDTANIVSELISIALKYGANLNEVDSDGNSFVHNLLKLEKSAGLGPLETMLSFEPDLAQTNNMARSALVLAMERGVHLDIVKALLQGGANPNEPFSPNLAAPRGRMRPVHIALLNLLNIRNEMRKIKSRINSSRTNEAKIVLEDSLPEEPANTEFIQDESDIVERTMYHLGARQKYNLLLVELIISFGARLDTVDVNSRSGTDIANELRLDLSKALKKFDTLEMPASKIQKLKSESLFSLPAFKGGQKRPLRENRCQVCDKKLRILVLKSFLCGYCDSVLCSSCASQSKIFSLFQESSSAVVSKKVCVPCFNYLCGFVEQAVNILKPLSPIKNSKIRSLGVNSVAQREDLFGKRNIEEETKKPAVNQTLSVARDKLRNAQSSLAERGEKLESLSSKASAMETNAEGFASLARKIREKQESKNKSFLGSLFG